jgi:hypothetical protein
MLEMKFKKGFRIWILDTFEVNILLYFWKKEAGKHKLYMLELLMVTIFFPNIYNKYVFIKNSLYKSNSSFYGSG